VRWLAPLILLFACGDDDAAVDAGLVDAGALDAGALDAGASDAGSLDAGRLPAPRALPSREEPPSPFVSFFDGSAIEDADDWNAVRRPELLELFQHYVYGFLPDPVPVEATLRHREETFLDGVVYEEHELRYGPAEAPPISLALFRPSDVEDAPVLLALNKCGNQSLAEDPRLLETRSWFADDCGEGGVPLRGVRASSWPIAEIVGRGYALATFHESDVDPDDADDPFADGIHPHFEVDAPPEAQWGTLSAWSYGLMRVVDFLQIADGVDGARIATVGHSRRGKAALWAAALDARIALTIPHQSGTGGATLSRSYLGESVLIINAAFPHWFDDLFEDFGNRERRLPIDQHLLLALVAPRAVLVTNGDDDTWADPPGALRAVELAAPVWPLLTGEEGLVLDGDAPSLEGPLSWASRPGDHSLRAEDWDIFMDFADRHL